MISAKNKEGSSYWLAVDTMGNFLFEPQCTDAAKLLLEDGAVLVCDPGEFVYGPSVLVSMDGRVLYECSSPDRYIALNNGVVCEYVHNTYTDDSVLAYIDIRSLLVP